MTELEKACNEHCENMRPGSNVPHTQEFKDAWEIRVSFEAGAKWQRENIAREVEDARYNLLGREAEWSRFIAKRIRDQDKEDDDGKA
jgi:hypothetical protein